MRAVASDFKGGERRFFSSGDKRDKEGDRETTGFCKCLALCDLTIRKTRKPRLFPPESRAYFPRPAESRAYFPRPPGCEKSPSRESRAYFPRPQGARNRPLGESRAYFPRPNRLQKWKPRLFPPAPGGPTTRSRRYFPRPQGARNRPWAKAAPISPGSWNPISRERLDLHGTLPVPGRAPCSRTSVRCPG